MRKSVLMATFLLAGFSPAVALADSIGDNGPLDKYMSCWSGVVQTFNGPKADVARMAAADKLLKKADAVCVGKHEEAIRSSSSEDVADVRQYMETQFYNANFH
jgi:hypothetical protein